MNDGDKHVGSLQHHQWKRTHPHLSNLGALLSLLSHLITSDGSLDGESDTTPGIVVARTN